MMGYSILIQWSEADKLYLVTIAEFDNLIQQPCTSGKTYQDALDNAQDCIAACLEYWQETGIAIPPPATIQAA